MFELLDDQTDSPKRMPSSQIYRHSAVSLDDILVLLAFGGLVLGGNIPAPRIAQLAAWLVAAAAGWWLVYRFVRRLEPIWWSEPSRRPRIVFGSVLFLLGNLGFVYGVAIRSETTVKVVCGIAWSAMLITLAVQYFRRRRESI